MGRFPSKQTLRESAQWALAEAFRLDVDAPRPHIEALLDIADHLGRESFGPALLNELPADFWMMPEARSNTSAIRRIVQRRPRLPAHITQAFEADREVPSIQTALSEYVAGQRSGAELIQTVRVRASTTTRPAAILVVICLAPVDASAAIEAAELFVEDNEAPHVFLLLLLIFMIANDSIEAPLVEQVFELWGYYGVFDILIPATVQQFCVILLARETPLVDLAGRLDDGARQADPAMHQLAPYHLMLALPNAGSDEALKILQRLIDEERLVFGDHGVGRRAVLDLAASRPAEVRELLAGNSDFASLHAALSMDLELGTEPPETLREAASQILRELHEHRVSSS